jgi:hypothetical protein
MGVILYIGDFVPPKKKKVPFTGVSLLEFQRNNNHRLSAKRFDHHWSVFWNLLVR